MPIPPTKAFQPWAILLSGVSFLGLLKTHYVLQLGPLGPAHQAQVTPDSVPTLHLHTVPHPPGPFCKSPKKPVWRLS